MQRWQHVVEVEIRRRPKPEPEPMPTRAADGTGWFVQCATCGRNRTVTREAIMGGQWLACPSCEVPVEQGRKETNR